MMRLLRKSILAVLLAAPGRRVMVVKGAMWMDLKVKPTEVLDGLDMKL